MKTFLTSASDNTLWGSYRFVAKVTFKVAHKDALSRWVKEMMRHAGI